MLRNGLTVAVAFLFAFVCAGAGDTTSFLQTHYYLLSLGQVAADIDSIRQEAQSSGYSLITYSDNSAEAWRGGLVVETAPEDVLADERLLAVDGERFLLRQSEAAYAFTVRPAESGYELVIDPHQDQAMADVLGQVLGSLQSLGILGDELSLDVRAYAKDDVKGPPPPIDVAIDSTLYGLSVARDWFDYAAQKGLTRVGLRVEVVAEVLPGASLAGSFEPYIVDGSATAVKLRLPIEQLLALARSSGVGYVREPYRPAVP